jgi:hypothetical protein
MSIWLAIQGVYLIGYCDNLFLVNWVAINQEVLAIDFENNPGPANWHTDLMNLGVLLIYYYHNSVSVNGCIDPWNREVPSMH